MSWGGAAMALGGLLAVAGSAVFIGASYPVWMIGGVVGLFGLGLFFYGAFAAGVLVAA